MIRALPGRSATVRGRRARSPNRRIVIQEIPATPPTLAAMERRTHPHIRPAPSDRSTFMIFSSGMDASPNSISPEEEDDKGSRVSSAISPPTLAIDSAAAKPSRTRTNDAM